MQKGSNTNLGSYSSSSMIAQRNMRSPPSKHISAANRWEVERLVPHPTLARIEGERWGKIGRLYCTGIMPNVEAKWRGKKYTPYIARLSKDAIIRFIVTCKERAVETNPRFKDVCSTMEKKRSRLSGGLNALFETLLSLSLQPYYV